MPRHSVMFVWFCDWNDRPAWQFDPDPPSPRGQICRLQGRAGGGWGREMGGGDVGREEGVLHYHRLFSQFSETACRQPPHRRVAVRLPAITYLLVCWAVIFFAQSCVWANTIQGRLSCSVHPSFTGILERSQGQGADWCFVIVGLHLEMTYF